MNNDLPYTGDGSQRIEQYVAIFDCMIDPKSRRYLSEDYALCRRLQQVGEKVWLDARTTLSHEGAADYPRRRTAGVGNVVRCALSPEPGRRARAAVAVAGRSHRGASAPLQGQAVITEIPA